MTNQREEEDDEMRKRERRKNLCRFGIVSI